MTEQERRKDLAMSVRQRIWYHGVARTEEWVEQACEVAQRELIDRLASVFENERCREHEQEQCVGGRIRALWEQFNKPDEASALEGEEK